MRRTASAMRSWSRATGLDLVHAKLPERQLEGLRASVNRGRPWGGPAWVAATATRLGPTFTLRSAGRPKKVKEELKSAMSPFPSATWESQSVDSTTVLNKYTFCGDTDLGGVVNLQDFNKLAANFGQSNRRFTHGDINYDTAVNLQDFNRLAGNFGQTGLGPDSLGEGEDEITTEDLEEMLPPD
jgi:hypothetical protein